MRNLLIIYNVLFLLFGNVLFSSIHYLHHHHYDNEIHEDDECNECLIIENSNNYISDFQQVNFSNDNIDEYVVLYTSTVHLNIYRSCSARSPPFSL